MPTLADSLPLDQTDADEPTRNTCGGDCGHPDQNPDDWCAECRADYNAWCDFLAAEFEAQGLLERGIHS
jgi:hypothetical protein